MISIVDKRRNDKRIFDIVYKEYVTILTANVNLLMVSLSRIIIPVLPPYVTDIVKDPQLLNKILKSYCEHNKINACKSVAELISIRNAVTHSKFVTVSRVFVAIEHIQNVIDDFKDERYDYNPTIHALNKWIKMLYKIEGYKKEEKVVPNIIDITPVPCVEQPIIVPTPVIVPSSPPKTHTALPLKPTILP